MFTLIFLLASLFGRMAGEIAPSIKPDGPSLSTRAGVTSQGPLRPIAPQTKTLEGDGTACLDPDGRIIPCRPHVP
jgi:hypothetical protein